MKVALITETYPPEVNGVAMTLSRLVAQGVEHGHRFQILRPRQGRDDHPRDLHGVEHVPMPGLPVPMYQSLRFGLPMFGTIGRLWKKSRPDVVHVATEGPLGFAAVNTARRMKIPVLSTYHTNFQMYGAHYGMAFMKRNALRYLRYIHNETRMTLVPSQSLRDHLAMAGFHNLDILGRGVDTDLYHPGQRDPHLRSTWGADDNTPVALYVGRIAAEKNLPLVLKAADRLKQKIPNLKVVLVGDGPELPTLAKQRPDFFFAGLKTGKALASHYASGDLFLFASVTETFGNVVTEALASGLPVLAYDYAAPREHIDEGVNGWLATYADEQAFLAAADRAAADFPRWQEMRTMARSAAEKLSWTAIFAKYEGFLELVARG